MDIILENAVENNQTVLIKAAIDNGADIDNLYTDAYIFAVSNGYIAIVNDITNIRNNLKSQYNPGG